MKLVAPISSVTIHVSIDKKRAGERFPTLHVKTNSKYYDKKDRHPSNLLETAEFEWAAFIKDLEKFIGVEIFSWNCYYTMTVDIAITDDTLSKLLEIKQKIVNFCSEHFE